MLKISLNRIFFMALCNLINTYSYRKDQSFPIDRGATSGIGKRFPCWQEPYIPYALPRNSLKSQDLKSEDVGSQTEMTLVSVNAWVKRFESEGIAGLETRPGRGRKPIMDCLDKEAVRKAIEQSRQSVKKAKESWQQASGKEASESTFRAFIRIGTRYRRIRKRSKGKPSPQLYAYKIAHLNIVETLWRILKGKWLRQADYVSTDSLFYATNRALAAVGDELIINFTHAA